MIFRAPGVPELVPLSAAERLPRSPTCSSAHARKVPGHRNTPPGHQGGRSIALVGPEAKLPVPARPFDSSSTQAQPDQLLRGSWSALTWEILILGVGCKPADSLSVRRGAGTIGPRHMATSDRGPTRAPEERSR